MTYPWPGPQRCPRLTRCALHLAARVVPPCTHQRPPVESRRNGTSCMCPAASRRTVGDPGRHRVEGQHESFRRGAGHHYFGHLWHILHKLTQKSAAHAQLMERIPAVEDLVWLLLFFCTAAESNFLMRPHTTLSCGCFGRHHSWTCSSKAVWVHAALSVCVSQPNRQLGRAFTWWRPATHDFGDDGESIDHSRPFSHHPSCLVLRAHSS